MNLSINKNCLHVLKALSCQTRLDILKLLVKKPMNQQELAETLNISPAIMSGHMKQLSSAGLVFTENSDNNRGRQKIWYVAESELNLKIIDVSDDKVINYELPIGLYSRHSVEPSCGIATLNQVVGSFDDKMVFFDPLRTEAAILWFKSGYVEYVVPLNNDAGHIIQLKVSLEMASEFPGHRENWPSQINFSINHIDVGNWICPGNFGERRGIFTPAWWPSGNSQYGILKTLTINESGSYIDDAKISDITINDIDLHGSHFYLRFSANADATPAGGLTIFGNSFGDYNQNIIITTYHK